MNIGYHYYTVKTLARKAGFLEGEAQVIAFYSQMVDNFVLSNNVVLNECPPDFFIKNGLARKQGGGEWEFLPCPTGIDFLKSTSHDFERHTLASFHFIPEKPLPVIEENGVKSRLDYRCKKADRKNDSLIAAILREAVCAAKKERSRKNLMRLGMALHTFADTYAHCNFSGLHGYENEAEVKKAVRYDGKPGINEAEILFFKDLPSIGHGNIGSVPDICTYKISYAMKSGEKSKLDYIVTRDNAEFFAECSMEIYTALCEITGETPMGNDAWEAFKKSMIKAQAVHKDEKKYLTPSWSAIFPDISYDYDKNAYFLLNMRVEKMEGLLMDSPAEMVSEETLQDAFSCEGNQCRNGSRIFFPSVTQDFFDYNELAYERVRKVTGEYRGKGRFL